MKKTKKNGGKVEVDRFHNHPEIKEGEVFIGNKCVDSYKRLPYLSMRIGEVALDRLGVKINKSHEIFDNMLFPVFVKEEEFNSRR